MSRRLRPFAILAIVASLFLASAPVTAALPDAASASPGLGERLLSWLGEWADTVAYLAGADHAPPDRDLDAAPVPTGGPESPLQSSPEGEAGPDVDPDG